jgi:excinuclease ABC subunit C
MEAAAEAWHYERAGSLKARLDALAWLEGRLQRFHAGADRLSFVYRALGHDGSERLYLVRRGTVRAELAPPTSPDEAAALEAQVRRVFDAPDGADIPTHDLDEFYLVASWFRRHPAELARATPVAPAER